MYIFNAMEFCLYLSIFWSFYKQFHDTKGRRQTSIALDI